MFVSGRIRIQCTSKCYLIVSSSIHKYINEKAVLPQGNRVMTQLFITGLKSAVRSLYV